MLLQNKNAVIYGAGGSLGGAVAKAFAAAGARLFLTGRNISSVQKVADEIWAAGSHAETTQLDALDEKAISSCLNRIVQQSSFRMTMAAAGISCNVVADYFLIIFLRI